MSDFGKQKDCINGCGGQVYFDAHSLVGHPTSDKWLPLEVKEGRKTDVVHNCPNKKKENGSLTVAAAPKKLESLNFAESLCQVLQDYIRLKQLETAYMSSLAPPGGGEAKK